MNTLSLREAATKYDIPAATLSGWIDAGLIRIARAPEKRGQALLIIEADVATARSAYTPGRGHHNQRAIVNKVAVGAA